ncbi:head-tail connector protein [Serratia sp. JSRIV004]|uniref:head-tail connector protein n=1 Tax=Serratia sp. JSRIV004 TaxID=2831895 RepID=UPI001CBBC190|nr:head-tail connector protein [Serratia sp. JSRIV004]UAN58339.1 head-tail connector protein [Serratia sp. JSRIV004]
MVPSLEELKLQCRIDADDIIEDQLLTLMCAAAKRRAENFINRTLYDEAVPEGEGEGLVISADIKLALMLLVGHWFESREEATGVQQTSIPFGFASLLEPYRFIPL